MNSGLGAQANPLPARAFSWSRNRPPLFAAEPAARYLRRSHACQGCLSAARAALPLIAVSEVVKPKHFANPVVRRVLRSRHPGASVATAIVAQTSAVSTGQRTTRPLRHLFLFIGADPNAEWLGGCVDADRQGFVLTGQSGAATGPRLPLETSRRGVFAIGDVRAGSTKRVAAAVGEGAAVVAQIHGVLGAATTTA